MKWYVARRLAWTLLATFIIFSFTFGLLMASPNPEATAQAFQAAQEGGDVQEAQDLVEESRGEDRPVHEQYIDFLVSIYTLDWGTSFMYDGQSVTSVIGDAWIYSAMVVLPATFLAVILGFGIGIYSATHQYTKTDYAATSFAFAGISLPNFWFAIILILIFGIQLQWLPVSFDSQVIVDHGIFSLHNVEQLILPVTVLATAAIASEMRYARAEALEYVRSEWVKVARAKGVDEGRITYRHIFRPSLVPLITVLLGDLVGIIFASAYVIEVIFGIPGLGLISYNALIQQDTPLVLATILIPVVIAVIGNLLQDIAYTMLDPRIDYEEAET